MPRKRATRVNKRAKPKKPDGNIGGDLDLEEKRKKLTGFLQDFDIEVKTRLERIENDKKRLQTLFEKQMNIELSLLPPEIRNMNFMEFIAAGGTVENVMAKKQESRNDSLGCDETTSSCVTSKKTGKGASRKKAAAGDTQKKLEASSTASASAVKKRSRYQTPSTRQLPKVWDTPAITPKFDINLPFTPGLARVPKQGERLMSLAGSPVEASRNLKFSRIKEEEEELDRGIVRELAVAAEKPGFALSDVHRFIAKYTAATGSRQPV